MKYIINKDIICIGSQPAALVAVENLAASQADIYWLLGKGPAGGIFRGITLGNTMLDAGMNLLEFTALKSGTSEDIASYNPAIRYDATRFLPHIQQWLEQKIFINRVPTPQMLVGNNLFPDLLIANAPDYLHSLPLETRNRWIAELQLLAKDNPLHAGRKHTDPARFLETDYATVARANHPKELQAHLINPWLKKITGKDGSSVPALHHRQAWAPLFYPQTLIRFLEEPDYRLPPTEFGYPKGERFGTWMERAETKLRAIISQDFPISIQRQNGDWLIETPESLYQCRHLIYAGDIQSLLKWAGRGSPSFSRGKIGFTGVRIPETDFLREVSVVNIPDPELGLFRLTDQTCCSGITGEPHLITGEWSGNPPVEKEMRNLLERMGWLRPGGEMEWLGNVGPVPAFVEPIFENLALFRQLKLEAEALFPGILLAGSAAEITSVSLNDQIIQGLQMPYRL